MAAVVRHHPIFEKYGAWEGTVGADFCADFLGVKTRRSFYKGLAEQAASNGPYRPELPKINESYHEWIDVLEAVAAARETFTMIELGAGWGRWLVRAAIAAKHVNPLPCSLIGVEAEPTHFEWMKLHFTDNGLDPDQHKLTEAAASDTQGKVWFYTGSPGDWYGQCIWGPVTWRERFLEVFQGKRERIIDNRVLKQIKTVSLKSILRTVHRVDLVDLDVQGAEYIVLQSASKDLTKKVRRIHVGTHSPEIETSLRKLFGQLGWKNHYDFPIGRESETPFGTIHFGDGVQTWINPAMVD